MDHPSGASSKQETPRPNASLQAGGWVGGGAGIDLVRKRKSGSQKKTKSGTDETSVRKSTDAMNFQNGHGAMDRDAWMAKDGGGKGRKHQTDVCDAEVWIVCGDHSSYRPIKNYTPQVEKLQKELGNPSRNLKGRARRFITKMTSKQCQE